MYKYKNGEYIFLLEWSYDMPPGVYRVESTIENTLRVTLEEQREYFKPATGYYIELSKTVPFTKAVKVLYGENK